MGRWWSRPTKNRIKRYRLRKKWENRAPHRKCWAIKRSQPYPTGVIEVKNIGKSWVASKALDVKIANAWWRIKDKLVEIQLCQELAINQYLDQEDWYHSRVLRKGIEWPRYAYRFKLLENKKWSEYHWRGCFK